MKKIGIVLIVGLDLLACGSGDKAKAFGALDKHATEYGACRVLSEQKEVDGKPGWIAASVCDAQHRQAVLQELPGMDAKKFDGYFTDWKKEKGEAAVTAARKNPPPSGGGSLAAGGGRISESARMAIINECNLVNCKGVGVNNATTAHLTCLESCCRSKGMKVNCRE